MAKDWRKTPSKKILEAIAGSSGNVTAIARKLKCHRSTIARRIKEERELQEAYDDECETFGDIVELALRAKILEGNLQAILFALGTKYRSRGWGKQSEQLPPDDRPVIIDIDCRELT